MAVIVIFAFQTTAISSSDPPDSRLRLSSPSLPRSTTESGTTMYKISSGVLHLHHGIGRTIVLPCNWKESNISPPRPSVPSTDSQAVTETPISKLSS
ncbi:hypothetical protein GE21DRAFT_1285590 [Neurospora crassa]|nr:hypothetical protein GE21DRAFT_1285590 [Neurospora crassa]